MHHSLQSGLDKSSYSLISPDISSSLFTSDDAELYLQGEMRKREISRITITKREIIIHLFLFLPSLSFFLAAVIIWRGFNKTSTLLLGEDDGCLERHYSYCRFRPFQIELCHMVLVSYNLHQKPWSSRPEYEKCNGDRTALTIRVGRGLQINCKTDDKGIAPAFEAIKPDYDSFNFNYSAFSPYVGANDEVDKLWADLFRGNAQLIPLHLFFPLLSLTPWKETRLM